MFLQPPDPAGLRIRDTLRGNHVRSLESAQSLSGIPDDERKLILASLSATVLRADYHLRRFRGIREELDERRKLAPGDIWWDGLGRYLHFELQGYTAALRTSLDELVYLIARRHGVRTKKARNTPWTTSALIKDPLPADCDVEEIRALRSYADWYDELNAYRNASFHHGWISGTGHFELTSTDLAASMPSMNALLLPDRESLRGRGKPFEWTWDEGNNVDDFVERLEAGFDQLLNDIFEKSWNTLQPKPGNLPEEQHPTMMVTMPVPVYATVGGELIIPMFTTARTANEFARGRNLESRELHRIPVVQVTAHEKRVYLSTRGIEEVTGNQNDRLHLVVDPRPFLSPDGKLVAVHVASEELSRVVADEARVVSIQVECDELFIWRTPMVRSDF